MHALRAAVIWSGCLCRRSCLLSCSLIQHWGVFIWCDTRIYLTSPFFYQAHDKYFLISWWEDWWLLLFRKLWKINFPILRKLLWKVCRKKLQITPAMWGTLSFPYFLVHSVEFVVMWSYSWIRNKIFEKTETGSV